jgi:predicted short-subunit dehydrogenase-like oxidoreductase (DUF2520 family)
MDKQSIGIIGYGKLGKTLALKFIENEQLKWVCSASACNKVPNGNKCYKALKEISELTDIIFITKADKYIKETAEELTEIFGKQLSGKIIIHCSGLFPKTLLKSCENKGAVIAKAHPYQTFYFPASDVLDNVFWTVDADSDFNLLNTIIKEISGTAVNTNTNEKFNPVLYHASAVMASNYMNTIVSLVANAARESGINPADFLPEILETTLNNIIHSLTNNVNFPLTGPIVRGDVITIEKHIEGLKDYKLLRNEYCRIGLSTAELAYKADHIDKKVYNTLIRTFLANID